jgi:hypothetical protein
MTTTEQRQQERELREQDKKLKAHQSEVFCALIAEQVIHHLGEPKNLIQVQVRRLWEDRYRANVFVGAGITSATIVNSYFLVTDSNGKIIEATPTIKKQCAHKLAQ